MSTPLFSQALVAIIQEAGEGVIILGDGIADSELLGSRLARHEMRRQVQTIARSLGNLEHSAAAALPEIDWAAWATTARQLGVDQAGPQADEALLFAARSLVPATLMWLRVYQQNQPGLFAHGAQG